MIVLNLLITNRELGAMIKEMLLIFIEAILLICAVAFCVVPMFGIALIADKYGNWALSLYLIYFFIYLPLAFLIIEFVNGKCKEWA